MHFEFESGFIETKLYSDLGFEEYLKRFQLDIPFVNKVVLRPLTFEQAKEKKEKIGIVEKSCSPETLRELIDKASELANLETLILSFQSGALEPSDLFLLYQFTVKWQNFSSIEKKAFGYPSAHFENVHEILRKHLDSTGNMVWTKEIQSLLAELVDLAELAKLSESDQLQKGLATTAGVSSQGAIAKIHKQIEDLCGEQIHIVNLELKPFSKVFCENFNKLQKQVILYGQCLVRCAHSLNWPEFVMEQKISAHNIELPLIKEHCGDKYDPQSVEFNDGGSVLFGSNMTGKTSLMSTLYFSLALTKVGLPLPASRVKLRFPSKIHYHFRTSGNLNKNLSGFTEELSFLSQTFEDGSYIFMDEPMQSTNPTSGSLLLQSILQYFAKRRCFFICSTHYIDILKTSFAQKKISFYKMSSRNLLQSHVLPSDVESKSKFEIQKIENGVLDFQNERVEPLKMAANSQLPEDMRAMIKEAIQNIDKSIDKNTDKTLEQKLLE